MKHWNLIRQTNRDLSKGIAKGERIQGTKLSMKINMAKVLIFFYHFFLFSHTLKGAIIYLRSDFFFLSALESTPLENCFYNEVQEFVF
jgi:hypothetical protein